ncbi:ATP-dependent helicase [Anaerosporobacter faecicola]|uniref:ATP-dependent helicase n=1 Tax=Anaerosporobacter faecicola TaxID=2718714 RepID=UPI00143B6A23|nr:ATP-dependent helicase [Anaerosporobacter faecicola]
MKFNASQLSAIQHKNGPMLVLAGPGSGKTAVITKRTQYLIEECGINPLNILVITFTKAAASEMKTRFHHLMKQVHAPVCFGTFHSIFFTILKYAYNYSSANIISEEARLTFIRSLITHLNIEIDDEKEFTTSILNEISLVKGDMLSLDHYYSINCSEDIFKKIYTAYENKLRQENLIDFDDMLVFCYELLKERPDILALWQKKFQYILIDEFQDINRVQYEIIKMLSLPQNNLFIVGDDDQSIYRFRGAKPEIMLNFENDYPIAKRVLLNINYRSSENIVRFAGRLIKNNKKRFQKEIIANRMKGSDPIIQTFKDLTDENTEIIKAIQHYHDQGVPYNEIAVLFRTSTGPRALVNKLMDFNIPFRMKDALPNIYEHWIAKNLLAYIKIALGNYDRNLFLQIANRPKRYLARDIFDSPTVNLEDIKGRFSDKEWMLDRILKLEYDLAMLKKMTPYAAIQYIRKAIGYEEYLNEYATFRRIKVEELLDVLDELQEGSKQFETYDFWFAHIETYSQELREQLHVRKKVNYDSVSLSTMHSSKGLEYTVVFIIDANEGITPHSKALSDADLEEERRMFYVAMTRAKQYLHIYSVKERYNKELSISRFVGELLVDVTELKEQARIEHRSYGPGTILKNTDGKLIIYFDKLHKERVLDLNFCIGNHLIKVIED